MADRIVIPLGAGDWIALSPTELAAHRAAARALGFGTPTETVGTEPLCTAEELAAVFKVPQTRIEQGTREGTIPCVRIGRWIRYRRHDVEVALIERGGQ